MDRSSTLLISTKKIIKKLRRNVKKMKKQNAKSKQTKILEESKGITLIALVTTIIVLLILAGITISTIIGDGILISKQKLRH